MDENLALSAYLFCPLSYPELMLYLGFEISKDIFSQLMPVYCHLREVSLFNFYLLSRE